MQQDQNINIFELMDFFKKHPAFLAKILHIMSQETFQYNPHSISLKSNTHKLYIGSEKTQCLTNSLHLVDGKTYDAVMEIYVEKYLSVGNMLDQNSSDGSQLSIKTVASIPTDNTTHKRSQSLN